MYSVFIFTTYVIFNSNANDITTYKYHISERLTVNDVIANLFTLSGVDLAKTNNTRFQELRDKLKIIGGYVINNDAFGKLLLEEAVDRSYNSTNFYDALNAEDYYNIIGADSSKNLYLKLKEKMNRDDIMALIDKYAKDQTISGSARKVMSNDLFGLIESQATLDRAVDEILGAAPQDSHTYDVDRMNITSNNYWDPKPELQDLQQHRTQKNRRIYRGEKSTVKYYPFMVSIHVMGKFWCGGVLYWRDIVLTSASCLQLMHNNRFFRENPRVLKVRVGSNHSRIGGEIIHALEVYFHPGYNPKTLRHNIAIIRLKRHVFSTYHRIPKLIEISHNEQGLAHTSNVLLLGWGVTKLSQKMAFEPIYLQKKFLPVYPNTFCKEVYGERFITQTMFCAGTITTGEGACDHDAGGPAILGGKLVGIISFGPAVCGFPNTPTVFTLVGFYSDWIETVNETMPDFKREKQKTTSTTEKSYITFIKTMINRQNVTPIMAAPSTPSLRARHELKAVTDSESMENGFSLEL